MRFALFFLSIITLAGCARHEGAPDAAADTELYVQRWRGHVTAFLFRGGAREAAMNFLHRKL